MFPPFSPALLRALTPSLSSFLSFCAPWPTPFSTIQIYHDERQIITRVKRINKRLQTSLSSLSPGQTAPTLSTTPYYLAATRPPKTASTPATYHNNNELTNTQLKLITLALSQHFSRAMCIGHAPLCAARLFLAPFQRRTQMCRAHTLLFTFSTGSSHLCEKMRHSQRTKEGDFG